MTNAAGWQVPNPEHRIVDTLIKRALALVDSSTSWRAYLKYDDPQRSGAIEANALTFSIQRVAVPEPGSLLLTAFGVAGLAATRRRKR